MNILVFVVGLERIVTLARHTQIGWVHLDAAGSTNIVYLIDTEQLEGVIIFDGAEINGISVQRMFAGLVTCRQR